MDSREVQTKTTDPDPEQEGEEGEVITTTTEFFTNMSKVNVYDHTGGGNVIANGAAAAALGTGTFKLTDIRDQHPYIVRRLADGNCWMVENLDLELSTSGVLTPADTDVSADWDPYESSGGAENFPAYSLAQLGTSQQYQYATGSVGYRDHWASKLNESHQVIVSSDETNTSAANGTPGRMRWYTNGVWYENNRLAMFPRSYAYSPRLRYVNGISLDGANYNSETDTEWTANHASSYAGTFYNYYAATAESTGSSISESRWANDSICPHGWQLPSYGSSAPNKSFGRLLIRTYVDSSGNGLTNNVISSRAIREIPLSFAFTGYYQLFNGIGGFTTEGRYVSAYADAGDSSTGLYITPSNMNTANSTAILSGQTIRCVARGNEHNVTPPEDVVQSTCAANSICYDANGGTGDTMANTGSATFGSSKVLSAPTYTRTGYAFVGWSESKDAVQSGAYIYGPNETITVPNLSSEGMTLYAQWLAPENSSYTMQAFGRNETVKTCSNMTDGNNGTTEERIALRDERDDNVYIVTKLKDGNCWMTSNLALNLADFAGKTTGTLLTPENTDLTASREDLSTLTIEGVGGEQSETISYWDPAVGSSENTTPEVIAGSDQGFYYNWYAAVAGSDLLQNDHMAPDSICPNGWKLPTSYEPIGTDYDISSQGYKLRALPLSFTLNGYRSPGGWGYIGVNGYYWLLSTSSTTGRAFRLFINEHGVSGNYSTTDNMKNAISMRCALR